MKPYVDLYNWDGMEFSTSIKDISKFEKNNPDIAVSVLYVMGKKINILRRSEYNIRRNKQVNLLLINDDKKRHYTAVKSLSRLLGSDTLKNTAKMHFCLNCLQAFPTIESRDKHHGYCKDHDAVKITMPTEAKKWLYYRDGQQQFKVPFAIYADFESLLVPIEDARFKKTKKLSKHVPCGWCTYNTFAYGDVADPLKVYRGEDRVTKFVNHLEDKVKRLYHTYPQRDMLPLTEVLKREHDEASKIHIYLKPFDDNENNCKVRDHCHYTGQYRGAAHNSCNIKYKIPSRILVIFHNLSGYDTHLFIRELGEKYDTQDIGCISENTEKYIIFNVKIKVPLGGMGYGDGEKYKTIEIRFIDSCRFMASSLDKLASNLNDEQCKNLCWFFNEDDTFQLMHRKGVYPYEYMDGWQRFEEIELPPKEAFYSKLNMKEGDNVTMGDYQDVYLSTDVLLLADVFETFQDVCLKNYKVDPAHFYSAPGLAWKAALKFTGIRLELLTDPDMHLMFEKGIRRGTTQAVHRYAKAKTNYMGDQYHPGVESSHPQYLDANNLYRRALR
ncbi:uncharacterized protein LOC130648072 [Hydractinia symbiolongicarpus]|uniref:uncharacterized protein LOC130648072 n=1 Tax=Hydractinia symbiolongicarpus TaxID=13093 RepID=UPI00254C2EAF|nr:uncharacterized protein LOC130648072 [Hydractinia symbiolongicarpus]